MTDEHRNPRTVRGRVFNGQIVVSGALPWPDGTTVEVHEAGGAAPEPWTEGHVVIAGFGLAGRCVAELLAAEEIPFTIVERNRATVETQEALGRQIIYGDITKEGTLLRAGLPEASALALTIPHEDDVLRAIALARRINPKLYIIARTNYSSKGLEAVQLGADDVVKAEQAVAQQFRLLLSRRLRRAP